MKFIIFSLPRCGSDTLLNDFKNNGCHVINEPFNPNHKIKYKTPNDIDCEGFKTLSLHRSRQENLDMLLNYKIIFLKRLDLFQLSLSCNLAYLTGIWQPYQLKKIQPVFLDINKIIEFMNQMKEDIQFYKNHLKNYLTVNYEDLYGNNRKQILNNIFNYLKVLLPLKPSQPKLNNNYSEIIKNYQDIVIFKKDKTII